MSLRPARAHWFETRVPREKTVYAMESLASTGQVELEQQLNDNFPLDSAQIRETVDEANRLCKRYAGLLPTRSSADHLISTDPETVSRQALRTIRHWLARRLRQQRQLSRLEQRLQQTTLLMRCLEAMGGTSSMLGDFSHETGLLYKRIYACPRDAVIDMPARNHTLAETYSDRDHTFLVVACLPEERSRHDLDARRNGCTELVIPDWLPEAWDTRENSINDEIASLLAQIETTQAAIDNPEGAKELDNALKDIALLDWFLRHSVALSDDNRHCRITGWTTVTDPATLQRALLRDGIDVRIYFRPSPLGTPPPVSIHNNPFTAPFRLFVNLAGTPGAGEIDPSSLLALLVPLLFGLMFPDVGHGLVLAVASLLLRRRFPALTFLVPCGISSMLFGVLFGEVFGMHDLIPAVLVCPLDDPLFVLIGSLALGACIILLGLALSGIEAHWQGRLRHWIRREGAVLVLYLGTLATIIYPPIGVLPAAAIAVFFYGVLATARQPLWKALLIGLGSLLHSAIELALNTLSFVRVGAFTLAHSALSHALLELTQGIETSELKVVAMIFGHGFIIVVEALIVSVQTTRLVLFEFFTRFLRADGRLMRPLRRP